jgi:hypothetical protein
MRSSPCVDSRFKRHFALAETHPRKMSDKHYVNYRDLHVDFTNYPLYPGGSIPIPRGSWVLDKPHDTPGTHAHSPAPPPGSSLPSTSVGESSAHLRSCFYEDVRRVRILAMLFRTPRVALGCLDRWDQQQQGRAPGYSGHPLPQWGLASDARPTWHRARSRAGSPTRAAPNRRQRARLCGLVDIMGIARHPEMRSGDTKEALELPSAAQAASTLRKDAL